MSFYSVITVWSGISEKTKQDRPLGCYKCNYTLTINRPVSQRTFLYNGVPDGFQLAREVFAL